MSAVIACGRAEFMIVTCWLLLVGSSIYTGKISILKKDAYMVLSAFKRGLTILLYEGTCLNPAYTPPELTNFLCLLSK